MALTNPELTWLIFFLLSPVLATCLSLRVAHCSRNYGRGAALLYTRQAGPWTLCLDSPDKRAMRQG